MVLHPSLLSFQAAHPFFPRTYVQTTTFPGLGTYADSSNAPASRIFATGEMADLVRAFDWSATPLGPIESWGDPLLTCVNLVLGSRHPMFLWWGPEAIQFYNDAYRPSLGAGTRHPNALGQRARECWIDALDFVEFRLNVVMTKGEATWYENQLVPIVRNGQMEDVYWTWSDSPVRDSEGNVVGVLVTCTETTDRVIADRELNRSRERLQLAVEGADLGTWSYSSRENAFTADARMQRMFGAPADTGDENYWQQMLHHEDREAAHEGFLAALAGLRPYQVEYRVLHPEGVRWIRSKGKVLEAEDGTQGMFAIVEDITQSKLAEIELVKRARELRESERIGKMGSWRLILATGELTWSEEVYRIMEHDPSLPVLNYAENPDIIDKDSNRRLEAAVAQCIATGEGYELDVKMCLPPNDKKIWLATRGEAVFGPDGSVIELIGTVRDITDRKLAEEALRSSEERLQLALEAASLGTWSYDSETGLSTGDAAMMRMFGSTQASGDFNYWIQFSHPDDREAIAADFARAMEGPGPYETEYRIIRPTDGEVRWIRSRGYVSREPDRPVSMSVVVEDVTERKRTEAVLLRTEKLAAVGRLASSIAHEINNPLESVTNLIYLAKLTAGDGKTLEYLSLAEQELSRASAITTQTLRFHRQSSRPTEVTFDDLMVNVLAIMRSRLVNARVTVEVRKRTDRAVLCFDGEIRQVLYNLLINSVDAMQQAGGRLLVRCRDGHDDMRGHPGLILTIADTGTGMSPETLSKIFEPFYSTKGVAGTGLGLWISKEIIGRHHGRIRVRSCERPGHSGTVFTIFLPCDSELR
jgi:PAS domain S-box-containing protein